MLQCFGAQLITHGKKYFLKNLDEKKLHFIIFTVILHY